MDETIGSALVPVQTPAGDTVILKVVDVDGSARQQEQKVSGGVPPKLADALKGVDNFAAGLREVLRKVAPDKTSVQLSIGFAMQAGKLTALFVDGKAEGAVTVTLEWGKD